ncbi:PilW family protein [Francisella adeliensis]|uniref:Prepilin-type N-terminal cleavage/methylation domain-containing protein n=1 Tax=Francisella adeliensis TaxID=2007306 RepID=A0A2Z4XYK8_9GAMM|nr:prepilin-type N-terminal cleavage/methylation domain-containing protein [Francisella adeliensis]AXA33572.1 prepilin-type cleavage/methylation domain-containing protein [Francisella adeliensis]MBK2084720.1 prepilin-type N-terminal cleavage/methylation domain-containing protein [Francisella adeliensis]MBK2097337.1 prepilin-type N-terminal cleavage/methylation domain-containing protein [Francisella adeliensis]QIW11804.1 prepilin-type N-terminal cleavage/methylation domain-containing protein [Fr
MKAMKYKKIAGFTLPELMVSMVIAALVMGMALNIYIDMKNQYNKLDKKHQMNTKQLMIKQIFYNAIGGAGFASKYGDMYQGLVDNSGDNFGDIFGKTGIITIGKSPITNMPSLPGDLKLDSEQCKQKQKDNKNLESMSIYTELHCVQPKTDFIMIQRTTLDSSLKTNSSNNIFKLNEFRKDVSPEQDIKANDYLVLCNATECELEKVSAITGDFVSTSQRIEDKFKESDYVGKYILETFFIADTGRKDRYNKEIYALYEFVKQGPDDTSAYELIDGVSDLSIKYVFNKDIKQGDSTIKWQKIKDKLIIVRSDKIAALKLSFKVDGKEFSKIYLMGTT